MTKIGDYLKVFGNVASAIQAENESTHVSAVNDSDVVLYEKGYIDYSEEYLYINSSYSYKIKYVQSTDATGKLYYSYDKITWTELQNNVYLNISSSGTIQFEYWGVYLKGNLSPSLSKTGIGTIYIVNTDSLITNSDINIYGNIMSLCWGDAFKAHHNCDVPYYFANLFNCSSSRINLENLILPNSLSPYCFYRMFYNQTILNYPKLPALNLEEGCYMEMFGSYRTTKNSSPNSINIILDLPAQYVPSKAYTGMLDVYNNKFSGTINMNYFSYENEDAVKLFALDYASATSIQQQFDQDALQIKYKIGAPAGLPSLGIKSYFESYNATTNYTIISSKYISYELIKKYNSNNSPICTEIKINTLNTNSNGININNSNSIIDFTFQPGNSPTAFTILDNSSDKNNYDFTTECSGTVVAVRHSINKNGTVPTPDTFIDHLYIQSSNTFPKPIVYATCDPKNKYPIINILYDSDKLWSRLVTYGVGNSIGKKGIFLLYNISNYPFIKNEEFDTNTNNKWNNYIVQLLTLSNSNNLTGVFTIPQDILEQLHVDPHKRIYIKAKIEISGDNTNINPIYSNETIVSTDLRELYKNEYFTITKNNVNFSINVTSGYDLYYSVDKYNWYKITDSFGQSIVNQYNIYIKGYITNKNATISSGFQPFFTFTPTTSGVTIDAYISGNIRSLIYGDNFLDDTCNYVDFRYAFTGTNIYSAEHLILPSTGLTDNCFEGMFSNSAIVIPPELPATILSNNCYKSMFRGCTALRETPKLPAINLNNDCYRAMFEGCANLQKINSIYSPYIRDTDGGISKYSHNMFNNASDLSAHLNYNIMTSSGIGGSSYNTTPAIYDVIPFEEQYLTQTLLYDGQGKFTIGKLINDKKYVYQMWLDDFDPNETWNYQSYINDPLTNGSNPYYYTGDTITYNNTKYYIWKYNYDLMGIEEGSTSADEVKYLFTTTINYNELYNESLEQDTSNVPTLLYGISGNKSVSRITYGIQENNYRIVKIEDKRNISYIAYSINNGESWEYTEIPNFNDEMLIMTPQMPAGSKILWKGKANRYSNNPISNGCYQYKVPYTQSTSISTTEQSNLHNAYFQYGYFTRLSVYDYICLFDSTTDFNLSGNIMSLLYGDDFIGQQTLMDHAFACLFMGSKMIKETKELCLPASNIDKYCYAYMFYGARYMKSMPMIVATKLYEGSCSCMFSGCFELEDNICLRIEELNNTKEKGEAKNACYAMFDQVRRDKTSMSLEHINLKANILTSGCYQNMFSNTPINTIPSYLLPASYLSEKCYAQMFKYCKKLTSIPENLLPAECLAKYCYAGMFEGCTLLASVPENLLPAITLKPYCYETMFAVCENLTSAPKLPALVVHNNSYHGMFYMCPKLNYIQMDAIERTANSAWDGMLNGVSSTITMVARYDYDMKNILPVPKYVVSTGDTTTYGTSNCTKYVSPYQLQPLTIKAIYTGTITINFGASVSGTVFISTNSGASWTKYSVNTTSSSTGTNVCQISLNKGNTIQIISYHHYTSGYSNNNYIYTSGNIRRSIHITGTNDFEAYGNIMSLALNSGVSDLNATTNWINNTKSTLEVGYFSHLFAGTSNSSNVNLVKADNLILSTTMSVAAYDYTFGRTRIEKTPIMPATSLAVRCYQGMYTNCVYLKTSSILPATTLKEYCYINMYNNCNSLAIAPILPATTISYNYPYSGMFQNCSELKYMKVLYDGTNLGAYDFSTGITGTGIFVCNDNVYTPDIDKSTYYCPTNFTIFTESELHPFIIDLDYNLATVYSTTIPATTISLYQGTVPSYNQLNININSTPRAVSDQLVITSTTNINSDIVYKFDINDFIVNDTKINTAYIDTINPYILTNYVENCNGYVYHINHNNNWSNYNQNNPETLNYVQNMSPNFTHPKITAFDYDVTIPEAIPIYFDNYQRDHIFNAPHFSLNDSSTDLVNETALKDGMYTIYAYNQYQYGNNGPNAYRYSYVGDIKSGDDIYYITLTVYDDGVNYYNNVYDMPFDLTRVDSFASNQDVRRTYESLLSYFYLSVYTTSADYYFYDSEDSEYYDYVQDIKLSDLFDDEYPAYAYRKLIYSDNYDAAYIKTTYTIYFTLPDSFKDGDYWYMLKFRWQSDLIGSGAGNYNLYLSFDS